MEQHKTGHYLKRGKEITKGVILIWHKPTPLIGHVNWARGKGSFQ